jgi:autotransporter-associated beta strand protein
MLRFLSPETMDRRIDRGRPGRGVRRHATRERDRHPHLESLESRIVLSTWTGDGADSNWMTAANWSGGTAPGNGASLVFPAGVSKLNTVNNFPATMNFSSIELDGSGYALSGNAISLAQGITTTYSSGTSSDTIDTQLGGPISVGAGGELDLDGALTGSAGLTVSGGGKVGLGGSASNTYAGTTVDDGSTLVLSKSGGAIAVPGDLVIGDGTSAAMVQDTASNQIATGSSVTINDDGTLALNGNSESIGDLTMTGGNVTTGAGTLTLGGDVTVNAPSNLDSSSIVGHLDLDGSARTFTVANGSAATDLSISAVISDSTAGITVTGAGTVDLSGKNTYSGTTTIDGSGTTLLVDGTVGDVQVDAGATLGGSGTVGAVNSTGGTLSPGDGNGALTAGSLILDTNSTFAAQLAGPTTTGFGEVVTGGAVILGGTLDATLIDGYTPKVGNQLTLIRNTSGSGVSGTFSGLPEGSTDVIDGYPFQITYKGGSGDDVVLTALPFTTTTTISASTSNSTYGQSVTFTAVVSTSPQNPPGGTLTGEVAFYDGNPTAGGEQLGVVNVNSQHNATFSTNKLNVTGSPHQIYAVYDPSASSNFASSTTTQPASVTINPLTIAGSLTGSVTKSYDGTTTATLSSGNYQLSGVINGDVVSLTGPTVGTYDTKDVGTAKTVSVSGLSLSGPDAANYVLANDSATGRVGVIVAKALTVTGITAQDKVYDGNTSATINTGAATLSGVIVGDDVSLVTSGALGSFADPNAGTGKSVLVTGLSLSGGDAGEYTIASPIDATASITPAHLTVTANPATMTYGGTVPALTDTISGLVGIDTPGSALSGSLATTATSSSPVGGYPITQGTLTAVNGNYTINFVGANLSVTPAALTITASNASKVYGAAIPAFTAAYSGFVNGDTAATLRTLPSLTTSATATSPVGDYAIHVGGAVSSNYTITYVPGTLTVSKASTAAALSVAIGTPVFGQSTTFTAQVAPISPGAGHPTGTVTFLVDAVPIATMPVNPTTGQASFSTSTLGVGSHTITATYSGDASFTSSQSGATQENVAAAATQSTLTIQAVRNKRGKIIKVELVSQVLVVSPGVGVPTGVVTYFRKGHPIRKTVLSNGTAVQTIQKQGALKKSFTIRYSGNSDFDASTSPPVVPTMKSLKMSARPLTVFLSRG